MGTSGYRDPALDPPQRQHIVVGHGRGITVEGPLATFKMEKDGSIELTDHGHRQIASSPPEVAESLRQLAERIIGHPVEIIVHRGPSNADAGAMGVEAPSTGETFGGGDTLEGRRRAHDWEMQQTVTNGQYRDDVMGWSTNPPATIAEAVGQAVGAGSTCFENGVPRGVMDERRAGLIVDALLDQIEKYALGAVEQVREKAAHVAKMEAAERPGPNLGLATNREMIEELATRWRMGEIKPDYRTVAPDEDDRPGWIPRGAATFEFDTSDISPETMTIWTNGAVTSASKRFNVELTPTTLEVAVNGLKVGQVSATTRDPQRWVVGSQAVQRAVPRPLVDTILAMVAGMLPAGVDKPSKDDLGLVQRQVDFDIPRDSSGEDEDEDEDPFEDA